MNDEIAKKNIKINSSVDVAYVKFDDWEEFKKEYGIEKFNVISVYPEYKDSNIKIGDYKFRIINKYNGNNDELIIDGDIDVKHPELPKQSTSVYNSKINLSDNRLDEGRYVIMPVERDRKKGMSPILITRDWD